MAFTATTTNSAAAHRPDLTAFEPIDVIPDALFLSHSTVAGAIQGDAPSLRVAYVVDDTAEFYAEGATFDESDPALSEALIHTAKFGQLVRLSNEQYGQNGTSAELSRSVSRAMTVKADSAFLAQAAPTGPAVAPAAGLVNVAGIVTKPGVSAALDDLIDLEAAVRANGANPTAWIMAPDCWAGLRKFKQGSTSKVGILGAGTDDAEPRLLSIPVIVNAQMPSLTGLLIDKAAIISAVSPLAISVDSSRYFDSDSVAVRATMRTGHAVPRPDRIGSFTIAAA